MTNTLCVSPTIGGDDGIEFFEKRVRPVLVEHCYECHSAEAKKLGGGLLLDSRAGLMKGGDSGPALEPGKPESSLLVSAVRYADQALQMPPNGKLSAAAIADLEAWVKIGAPDPRISQPTSAPTGGDWQDVLRVRRDWWSLRPVAEALPPPTKDADWSQQPIDRFILARLEAEGLQPAQPASAATLARRLALVLTGLPPTPAQVARLVAANGAAERQAVVEQYVDELLASPQFGEQWARHWMDIVRFTETHGNEWNYEVHHAWRYRDYLIRAFNSDLPYDQFVRENIAGDLLPPRWSETVWNGEEPFVESLIATAFYRFGEVNHDDCISLREIGYDLEDNQIDTLTKTFQATTVACARCHDHKLDAVSMKDYYALLGILRSSRLVSHTIDAAESNTERLRQLRSLKAEIRREIAAVWQADARQVASYLLAAQAKRSNDPSAAQLSEGLDVGRLEKWAAALAVEQAPLEDPLEPARRLAAVKSNDFAPAWQKVAADYAQQERERNESNRTQFSPFADFRQAVPADWQLGGQGLRDGISSPGEFTLEPQGESLIQSVLPAGLYTHALSQKLNGTLRSAVLPQDKKKISFQVVGQRSSAVRLVSNNCQLNYVNYRALTSAGWQWITFSLPDDCASLRTYAELMTMFDNPKFPDQLSALGGDNANYKLPWDKAAEDPRSYFGVTRVVLHDSAQPPQPELAHLLPLFGDGGLADFRQVAERYAVIFQQAVDAWAGQRADEGDVAWVDAFLRRGLLTNTRAASPRLAELVDEYRRTEALLKLPRVAPGMGDAGPGIAQAVFARGDCRRPGETVERRFLEVLSSSTGPISTSGSGRLELAQLIANPDNPLTARVMVNRVWHHLLGRGLVATVDDFGHIGELPSHPELLDYLAARFTAEGWSLKKLIRSIAVSSTFQTAGMPTAAARQIDPSNRLLSYYPSRRLEAEAIRDSMLAVSGRLAPALFGPSVQPFRTQDNADRRLFAGPVDGQGRRSVYIKNNLMESPQFLGAFNLPGGKVTQGRRDVTNVPAQALALLNDPFALGQAKVWASLLVKRPDSCIDDRIAAMFQQALGRLPTAAERDRFAKTVRQLAALSDVRENDILNNEPVWANMGHVVFNLAEFVYIP
ncbi:MAG TPA: PSD1 and planctomycete cytochrome C domain-containing protein [Pirellulales bacterium]|nr:PSD1 and planctomycete cytochrome C domain-containing protein [Pirellulales bacterium]